MDDNQFYLNCLELNISQVLLLSYSMSVSAMVFFVLTLIIIVLLIFHKAYNTTLQRFFIYLSAVTVIQFGCIGLNIDPLYDARNGDELCKWIAFFILWCALVMYVLALCISILLVCTIYSHLHSKDFFSPLKRSRKARICVETLVLSIVVLGPLAFLWIPFHHDTYGMHNTATCWMRTIDRNCTTLRFGLIDQGLFGFGMFGILCLAIILIFIAIAVQFCKYAYIYRLTRHQHLKTMRQTLILMSFMVVSALIETVGLFIGIYYGTITKKRFPFWFLAVYNGAIPFSQFIVPLGFMTYLYSNKKFQWRNIKKTAIGWKDVVISKCCCYCCVVDQPLQTENQQYERVFVGEEATAPPSTRVSAPSESFFNVEYTGEFTSITQDVTHDTGYGSLNL